jgi:hypothetical protein
MMDVIGIRIILYPDWSRPFDLAVFALLQNFTQGSPSIIMGWPESKQDPAQRYHCWA